jgi:hypothetical protein
VEHGLAAMRPDPLNAQLASPAGVWMYFAGVLQPGDVSGDDPRLSTDDRPWLELIGAGGEHVVGRRLQSWLADLRGRSAGRQPLTPAQVRAMDAGDALFAFSLALADGDEAATSAAQQRVRALLPAETYRALFP